MQSIHIHFINAAIELQFKLSSKNVLKYGHNRVTEKS